MALSKTWIQRLSRLRGQSRRISQVGVVAAAMFGAAAGCKVFFAPDRSDIVAVAQHVGNQQRQVGAFAADFVTTWLTATADQRAALQRFITIPDTALALPMTPAAVVSAPQVVSVIHTGTAGDAELWAATVSLSERPYASAQPTRSFYRVPVSVWNYQPRALQLPTRVNGPGPGADFTITYRQPLSTDSPLFSMVNGFIRTYLTDTTGLDRYALADSALSPVGGYQTAMVTSASADRAASDRPASGAQIRVLATVAAQTSQFATVNMVYPLTLENSGGTWMVAAIDLMPEMSDDEPNPIGQGHN